jgi:hypothetical protein
MMTTTRVAMALLLMIGVGVAGCGAKAQPTATADRSGKPTTASASSSSKSKSRSKPPPRLNSNTDPCAMRLHDTCAPLLLYFGRYQQLPEKIDELSQVPGVDVPPLVCPVSGEKYVYNPHGPAGTDKGTRIILYDATPAHAGRRWGIQVREAAPGQALVAKVVVVP